MQNKPVHQQRSKEVTLVVQEKGKNFLRNLKIIKFRIQSFDIVKQIRHNADQNEIEY